MRVQLEDIVKNLKVYLGEEVLSKEVSKAFDLQSIKRGSNYIVELVQENTA